MRKVTSCGDRHSPLPPSLLHPRRSQSHKGEAADSGAGGKTPPAAPARGIDAALGTSLGAAPQAALGALSKESLDTKEKLQVHGPLGQGKGTRFWSLLEWVGWGGNPGQAAGLGGQHESWTQGFLFSGMESSKLKTCRGIRKRERRTCLSCTTTVYKHTGEREGRANARRKAVQLKNKII